MHRAWLGLSSVSVRKSVKSSTMWAIVGRGQDWRKQIVGGRKPAKLMAAERTQRLAVSTREIVADDDRKVQRLGHSFDPADQVDGRPITVKSSAENQRFAMRRSCVLAIGDDEETD